MAAHASETQVWTELSVEMLSTLVSEVHRVAPNFEVYLGRTFLDRERPYAGLKSRFRDHVQSKNVEYGKAFFQVPVAVVQEAETLGLALVHFWSLCRRRNGERVLCCNNTVFGANGRHTDDPCQMIYVCLSPRSS
jgi:hypothetical protein